MCLQQQPLLQERLLLQPLGGDEPPTGSAPVPAAGSTARSACSAADGESSWLSRLSALVCCLPSPVALLKAAYVRWYDARARRRFLRRQRRWRQDCADMAAAAAAADPERGWLVTGTGGGGGAGGEVVERLGPDGDMVSRLSARLVRGGGGEFVRASEFMVMESIRNS